MQQLIGLSMGELQREMPETNSTTVLRGNDDGRGLQNNHTDILKPCFVKIVKLPLEAIYAYSS